MTALKWFNSSYSGNEGPECVEVAIAPADTTVHVRDSKDQDGVRLAFTSRAWSAFVGVVPSGQS
ncbi:DUF397 domain-containing protein [Streptomyces sp. NPDC005917]|uniref:DUF397 domain-containing protein n=1 Tax=unclassified Streptomyces TaxID=2593676 RepID=UPI0033C17781